MSFAYEVIPEDVAEKSRQFELLEEGIYTCEVLKATEKTSASGNPMIEIYLLVWNNQGKEFFVYDYLVFTEKMIWKVIHFCKASGLLDEYNKGTLDAMKCEGKSMKAEIVIQKGKSKPEGGHYRDKNTVSDYFMNDNTEGYDQKRNINDDSDLPF